MRSLHLFEFICVCKLLTMVTSCSAYNCNSRHTKNCGTSFYRFPKDPEIQKKWILATKRKNFVPNSSSRICSKHFTSDCFQIRPNCNFELLKPDAVPTKFEFPPHLSKPSPHKRRVITKVETHPFERENVTVEADKASTSSDVRYDLGTSPKREQNNAVICTNQSLATPTKKRLQRTVKILQQRLKRRDAKIKTMKHLLVVLKKKLNAPERLIEIVKENFEGFPLLHMFVQSIKNKKRSKYKVNYSEKMKQFALTLYFYSPKAYKFLRKENFILPNPSTLTRWISSFKCLPGFLEEVFVFFKSNVQIKTYLKHVSLVFDAMSIRKQVIYDHCVGKNFGYVTLGNNMQLDSPETLASEALVFQVVSLKGNFKCAVGYFFIDKINAHVLSKLIRSCILKLSDVGVLVENVTFDGTSTNISAVEKLGCKLPENPFFTIKTNNEQRKVCVMLDACHMLKLARNTLAEKGTIMSDEGEVNFKFIRRLHNLQTKQGLKFANKLSNKHIHFTNSKMNVKIAAQTLSSGVADALEFLSMKKDPEFVGAEATVKFIRVIDRLFDYLNTRDPYGKNLKSPIRKHNVNICNNMLDDCYKYLSNLKIENAPVLKHPRKTFALGFLTDINTIKLLAKRLLDDLDFSYVLTYKFSQDHLELLFSCIRSRGGNNNNPNVKQFQWALRKLMFKNSIQASDRSNCLNFDDINQTSVMSFAHVESITTLNQEEEFEDIENIRNIIYNSSSTYYKDNILYYISGFIVRKICYKVTCEECRTLLLDDSCKPTIDLSSYTHFTDSVSKGKLVRVSPDVMKLVKFLYTLLLTINIQKVELNTKKMTVIACREMADSIFKGHSRCNDYSEDSHEITLVKSISNLFYKTVCFHFAKEKTSQAVFRSIGVRQKLNKLVLFKNV